MLLAPSTVSSRIWGYDCGPHTNNLACCVGCLRRKLADAGAPDLIHTVRTVGYGVRRP
ncbi:helix-turn-helix domain-containing protein [Streptomyces sp. NPDC051315]|uniref:helix-turn-helix domain-containing protein n=1 Tax=Streptomyces sp. NPDC051315 TaxID=3365650 RepID=UPI003795AD5F